jgi:hypothetical protein
MFPAPNRPSRCAAKSASDSSLFSPSPLPELNHEQPDVNTESEMKAVNRKPEKMGEEVDF